MELMEGLGKALEELMEEFNGVNFSFDFGSSAIAVAAYIFMALGLFTIARNRGIRNPWLAWIPVANLWLLGCISDQYHFVTKGQERNRRKKMLTLSIIEMAIAPVMVMLLVGWIIGMFVVVEGGNGEPGVFVILTLVGLLLVVMVLLVALVVVSIMLQVQRCYAFYDLFSSCVPQRKKLYSALSIVASCIGIDLVAAIFIFLCRDKEEGMPPRIQE